jgi:hypothetical protein
MLSKDKKTDGLYRSRLIGMAGVLNLYLSADLTYTWREASLVASQCQGHGAWHARMLRTWICEYLQSKKLPTHQYSHVRSRILHDEDFSLAIKLHLQEKAKLNYIRAQDIVDFISSSDEMKEKLEKLGFKRKTIHVRTARCWLKAHDWRYAKKTAGMYVDGHEREDVVAYRDEFLKRWKKYEKRMIQYDSDGKRCQELTGFPVPSGQRFQLILITHDESTFYENDQWKVYWVKSGEDTAPQRKGEGESLMVSDFLTVEWGRLHHKGE